MKFSICMAAKNAESTIGNSIKSILEQSFKDYEIIVVDDFSNDRTIEIVKAFNDSRIKIFPSKYKGLLKARAQTIELAAGEYIITVDSDDALEDDALAEINKYLNETEVDVLNYKGIKISSNGKQTEFPDLFPNNTVLYENEIRKIFNSLVIHDDFTTLWNKAIKRSCIDIEHIKQCPNLSIGEDNIILLFTFPNVKSYRYINRPLYRYSFAGGITKNFNADSYLNQKKRMECKRYAIECAGFNNKLYDDQINIMFIETVSKVCAYFPTKVKSDSESKLDYYSCLKEIQNDITFWELYRKYKNRISFIYKIPIWMVKTHLNHALLCYKNICAKLRK